MFEKTLGKIIVCSGIRAKSKNKKYPTCKICEIKIKENEYTVTIHKVGEYPTEIHAECNKQLIKVLQGSIKGWK